MEVGELIKELEKYPKNTKVTVLTNSPIGNETIVKEVRLLAETYGILIEKSYNIGLGKKYVSKEFKARNKNSKETELILRIY